MTLGVHKAPTGRYRRRRTAPKASLRGQPLTRNREALAVRVLHLDLLDISARTGRDLDRNQDIVVGLNLGARMRQVNGLRLVKMPLTVADCTGFLARWPARKLPRYQKGPQPEGHGPCVSGGGEGNRTPDTGIFSPLLYQLSYPAEALLKSSLFNICNACASVNPKSRIGREIFCGSAIDAGHSVPGNGLDRLRASQSSIPRRRRLRFTSERRRLPSRRRRTLARVGLVFLRGRGRRERRSNSCRILTRHVRRFRCWLRDSRLTTTIPVGTWRMRTAESVVFTPWPPGPVARKALVSH